jgi:hypothetical protein
MRPAAFSCSPPRSWIESRAVRRVDDAAISESFASNQFIIDMYTAISCARRETNGYYKAGGTTLSKLRQQIDRCFGHRDAGRGRAWACGDFAREALAAYWGRSKPPLKRCSAGASKLRRCPGSTKLFSAQRHLRPTSGGEPVSSARRPSALRIPTEVGH